MTTRRPPHRRLAALAQRYELDAGQVAALASLLAILEADEHAPTTVREPALAVDVHLADSLVALPLDEVQGAKAIADIGAGAGFPGVVLAIALTGSEVALVESNRRKCEFMQTVIDRLALANARPVCARVEEWGEGRGANDLVVARAVASQPVVLEYAAPLLRVGGHLLDWRGARSGVDEDAALGAAEELGLERTRVERVAPFPAARDHHLHLFVKTAPTPQRYPRRAGIARKRPLGL